MWPTILKYSLNVASHYIHFNNEALNIHNIVQYLLKYEVDAVLSNVSKLEKLD